LKLLHATGFEPTTPSSITQNRTMNTRLVVLTAKYEINKYEVRVSPLVFVERKVGGSRVSPLVFVEFTFNLRLVVPYRTEQ